MKKIEIVECVKKYICPLLLLLLPLRHINQGIDMSDTGYNLACFAWFGRLDGMWVYVSYVANAVGHLFTKLPLGNTMFGMNLYCSLVVSAIALCAWYFLKEKIPFWIVFAGEILAIMLCWCPQVILYNYLTYLALIVGTCLLYNGIRSEKKRYYLLAGAVLGIGVGARFSNLTHMALILGLWYDGWQKRKAFVQIAKDTLMCVLGYAAGIVGVLVMIQIQYGLSGYVEMLFGLQTMSGGASGYSAGEMIAGAFIDYIGSMKWGVLFLLYMLAGVIFFRMWGKRFLKAKKVIFTAGLLVLFRLVYGRGMFGFDYYEYFSIFWWVSIFNTAALAVNVFVLFRKETDEKERLLALLTLVTILILPLGSNNRSYPVINNLFLIAPMTLYFLWKWIPSSYPVRVVAIGCLTAVALQSVGFGMHFVFRDGSFTEKRDTKVENNAILKGMYTTKANAEALTGITEFWKREQLEGTPVILYGDVPGLSYILDAPSALTSTWSNLESYNLAFWERDFKKIEETIDAVRPAVIVGNAYVPIDDKMQRLRHFLNRYEYEQTFQNEKVTIYQ